MAITETPVDVHVLRANAMDDGRPYWLNTASGPTFNLQFAARFCDKESAAHHTHLSTLWKTYAPQRIDEADAEVVLMQSIWRAKVGLPIESAEDEILPCPFCGHPARWANSFLEDDNELGCSNPNCKILVMISCPDDAVKNALQAWNARALIQKEGTLDLKVYRMAEKYEACGYWSDGNHIVSDGKCRCGDRFELRKVYPRAEREA